MPRRLNMNFKLKQLIVSLILITELLYCVEAGRPRYFGYQNQDSCPCGTRIYGDKSPLLVNGEEVADMRKYPWIVTIFNKNESKAWGKCGGAIISPRSILTAAHCCTGSTLLVGIKGPDNTKPSEIIEYERCFRPPTWNVHLNGRTWTGDVAVITLKKEIPCSEFNRPVCLPQNDIQEGDQVTVAGWGHTEEGKLSRVLREGTSEVINVDKCDEMGGEESFIHKPLDKETMFCTLSSKGKPCTGDSGSPLFLEDNGRFYVVGVVSYSFFPSCSRRSPTIYTRISRFMPFIKQSIQDLPSDSY